MAWDKVGSGRLDTGEPFVVERHVIDLPVPRASHLPIRLRSYRWRSPSPDPAASWIIRGRARTREEIDAQISALPRGAVSC